MRLASLKATPLSCLIKLYPLPATPQVKHWNTPLSMFTLALAWLSSWNGQRIF
jgi:hypothetical protein